MSRKPYWPQDTRGPEGRTWAPVAVTDEGASGVVPIAAYAGASTDANNIQANGMPQRLTRLCAITNPEPIPVVLHLRCDVSAGGGVATSYAFPAGGQNGPMGMALLEYGTGGVLQRAVCDLRSGSYQLPPCEQARVSVAGFTGVEVAFSPAVTVSGAFARGAHYRSSRPTYTWLGDAVAANTPVDLYVPDKAVELDAWCNGVTALGTGKPVLRVYAPSNELTPYVERDYTTGLWAPPYPCALLGGGRTIRVSSTVADSIPVVHFTLEL